MKRIDAEPVLIFVASEETFEQIIESILPEQRDQIIDCPTYTPDRTIAHGHCYGQTSTMEEIIPPALLASLNPTKGIKLLMSQEDFLQDVRGEALNRYEQAIVKKAIEDTGVLRGEWPRFDFVGRCIVGPEEVLRSIFPKFDFVHPAA